MRVPVIFKDEWIPAQPLDLTHRDLFHYEVVEPAQYDYALRKFGCEDRLLTDLMLEYVGGIRLCNNVLYRLLSVAREGAAYRFTFDRDYYFGFINSCEVLGYSFCNELCKLLKHGRKDLRNRLSETVYSADPFVLSNRNASIGICTMLIALEGNHSLFYIHERGHGKATAQTAEAQNTTHVVPAGTFQPRNELFFRPELSFYTNILREFSEELLGAEEFNETTQHEGHLLDNDYIKRIDQVIMSGRGRVYYLGMGLDCINTKPEVYSALVLDRKTLKEEFPQFLDNFEGKHAPMPFTQNFLDAYVNRRDFGYGADGRCLLPAGEACLRLVLANFDLFASTLD